MNRKQDPALGTAPVGKLFWRLALPAIAAQLVNVLYNIVDRIYIGHIPEVGAGNGERVRKTFRILFGSCLTGSMLVWAVCMLCPQLIAGMFTPDAELGAYTAWAMRIYMAASGIFGIQIACQQSFVSLGQAKVAIFLALLRKVILLIPLIFLLPRLGIFENAAFAVFLAEPVADTLAVCTTAALFFTRFGKLTAGAENA